MTDARPASAPAEHDIEAIVAEIRLDPARRDELVDLLREDAPIYAGRGGAAATRIRGWIMATFEVVGLPPAALPYVLESLESDLDPYAVAAAAKAVRGMSEPAPSVAAMLVQALTRLRARDDTVTFESLRPSWPVRCPTTALLEILASVRWLGDGAASQRGPLEALRRDTRAHGVPPCAARSTRRSTGCRRAATAAHHPAPPTRRPGRDRERGCRRRPDPPRGSGRPAAELRGLLQGADRRRGLLLHTLPEPQQVLVDDHQVGRPATPRHRRWSR